MTRRDAISIMGAGFGMVGFQAVADAAVTGPLRAKLPNFPSKAKRVIYLFLNGGPSQVDTFDPKPKLTEYHGRPVPSGSPATERKTGSLLRSPFTFRKYGQSGIEISEIFPKLAHHVDKLCVIRSMFTDRPNHEPSLFLLNNGDTLPGRPSMGSWITYGLGTEDESLPGFVVLCPGLPAVGHPLWSSAFLPAVYQGTYIDTAEKEPDRVIRNIRNQSLTGVQQLRELDLLANLNRLHMRQQGTDPQLEASIQSAELAFRMQTEAPETFDIGSEPPATRERYGDSDFGRGCLIARRLAERGVRMVQVYFGNFQPWDNHDDIQIHRTLAAQADPAIAGLLQDLQERGLLADTLVLIGGEFGRTPAVEVSGLIKVQNGRDHNSHGFTYVLAGGGVKAGFVYGATDEFGFKAVDKPVHVHDLHATVLHLMGLDHTQLTFRYSGRDFRFTGVAGNVVKDLIA
jgi:hypothetical protein